MPEQPIQPGIPAAVVFTPPRVWPAIVLPLAAMMASFTASSFVLGIAFVIQKFRDGNFADDFDPEDASSFVPMELVESLPVALMLILPAQLVMAGAALGAGCMSAERLPKRMGWGRSSLPWWSLPLLIAGTGFCGMIGALAVEHFLPDHGKSLELLFHMFRSQEGVSFWILAATVSLLPGFIEETLFRGYVQRRLLQRWKPLHAVAVSSLLFCAIHFDPAHMLAILPLSLWLGVVAWRCGSIWPAVACHIAQNLLASLSAKYGDPAQEWSSEMALALAVMCVGFVGAILVMRRHPPEDLREAGNQPVVAAA